MIRLLKNIVLPLALTALLVLNGCEDFVEVDRPSGQLTRPAVFDDATTAEAALLHIYARMRDWGMLNGSSQSITTKLGAYADEFGFYGSSTSATATFFNNNLLATDATLASWWREAYNQIYAANAVIEGVAASQGLTQAEKNEVTAEALFIRAYLHSYLAMLFGDIPYITATDYETNTTVSRTPFTQALEKAIADLEGAAPLMAEVYRDAERTRPNRAAVYALLARIYLYSGQWAAAADAASYVINNTALYKPEAELNDTFKKESTSTIWQYYPELPGRNTPEGTTFIVLVGPPSEVALSSSLLDAFEPDDLRRKNWVGEVSDGTDTWYFAHKYKEYNPTPVSMEYSIQLRLSEQYLIRAEARAQQGELITATDDLDFIRSYAGLGISGAETQAEILEAIYRERRVELFAEGGHRFFDLKRTGRLNQALAGEKQGWNTEDALLPIPENELLLNPNLLPQNPGY